MAKNMRDQRLPSGILLKDALSTTEDFLVWFVAHTEANEPHAVHTIDSIRATLDALPIDIDDLGKTEKELDAEFEKGLAKMKARRDKG